MEEFRRKVPAAVLRARVLIPIYVVLYAAALLFVLYEGVWGNVVLAGLDLLAIPLVAFTVVRSEVSLGVAHATAKARGDQAVKALVVLAIGHAIGSLVATRDLQLLFAFGPLALLGVVGLIKAKD